MLRVWSETAVVFSSRQEVRSWALDWMRGVQEAGLSQPGLMPGLDKQADIGHQTQVTGPGEGRGQTGLGW